MARTHTHVYRWDTRDWAQQPGGAGYVCTDCGFRIPENARPAAEEAGARFVPHSAAQEALRAHIDTLRQESTMRTVTTQIGDETMTTDREILETVARTLDEHTTDDWTGPLDAALEEMGLELGDSPDGSDPWHLATLADGRTIYLVDESARGWRRYSLA